MPSTQNTKGRNLAPGGWLTVGMLESVNPWEMSFADWLSILPSFAAAYAVIAAWRAQPRWLMFRRRQKALKPFAISRGATWKRVGQIMKSDPTTAAEEVDWLSREYLAANEPAVANAKAATAITFFASGPALKSLSKAYAAYAAGLRRGSFLRTTAVPVVERDAVVATEVSSLLMQAALGGGSETGCRCTEVMLTPSAQRAMSLWLLPDFAQGTFAYDLLISYRQHRLLVDYSNEDPDWGSAALEPPPSGHTQLQISAEEAHHLREQFSSARTFDSVLPSIINWRAERNSSSGRLRLHLALAETTYGSVLTDHYPQTFESIPSDSSLKTRTVDGRHARLLTLSTVLVSSDRSLLFAGRSKNVGSHPNQFGPAVNGNLEIMPRHGIELDRAATGVPDPLRALSREAREELGIDLQPEDIHVLGLGKFDVPTERGTHVLLTMARISMTANELAERTVDADPMEGRWELGGGLLEAQLPDDASGVEPLLSWLLHEPLLTPHATLAGIAAVARHFRVDPEVLERIATDPTGQGFQPRLLTFRN